MTITRVFQFAFLIAYCSHLIAGTNVGLLALNYGQIDFIENTTSHYDVVILQEYMSSWISVIKANNPNAKVLVYKNGGGMVGACAETGPFSSGVSVCEAENGTHEDWFLHRADGSRYNYCDYEYIWAANVNNTGYQQRWVDNVVNVLNTTEFDGVFIDDVNLAPGHCIPDTNMLELNSTAEYAAAVDSWMQYVGAQIRARLPNKWVGPNVGFDLWSDPTVTLMDCANATDHYAVVRGWVQNDVVTFINKENYAKWEGAALMPFESDALQRSMCIQRITEAANKDFLGIFYDEIEDVDVQLYGRIAWLMAWDGNADSALFFRTTGTEDPWTEEWTLDLGTPTSPLQIEASGTWRRNFTRGSACLNPTTGNLTSSLGELDALTAIYEIYTATSGAETTAVQTTVAQSSVNAGTANGQTSEAGSSAASGSSNVDSTDVMASTAARGTSNDNGNEVAAESSSQMFLLNDVGGVLPIYAIIAIGVGIILIVVIIITVVCVRKKQKSNEGFF